MNGNEELLNSNQEWLDLIEAHNDEISDAMWDAFKESFGNFRCEVIMDSAGNVQIEYFYGNDSSLGVFNGTHICLASFGPHSFDEYEDIDWFTGMLEDHLAKEEVEKIYDRIREEENDANWMPSEDFNLYEYVRNQDDLKAKYQNEMELALQDAREEFACSECGQFLYEADLDEYGQLIEELKGNYDYEDYD